MLYNTRILIAGIWIVGGLIYPAMVHAANVTCVGTEKNGVTCLTPQGMKTYTKANSTLPGNSIDALASCGNRIAVGVDDSISMFDGKSWAKPIKTPGRVHRLSCRANEIWIFGTKGIGYSKNGTDWQLWKRGTFFAPNSGVRGIAAGPGGTGYVISDEGEVAHYDSKTWKIYKSGQGFQGRVLFSAVTVDGNGRPWVVGGMALYAFAKGNWKMVVRPGATKFIDIGPKGRIWMGGGGRRTVIYTPGKGEKTFDLPRLNHGAVDGKGRLWVTTRSGIALWTNGKLEKLGKSNHLLPDARFTTVAVIGNGGELPAKK